MKTYIVEREFTRLCGKMDRVPVDMTRNPARWRREHKDYCKKARIFFTVVTVDKGVKC